jgi:hypothetical protein
LEIGFEVARLGVERGSFGDAGFELLALLQDGLSLLLIVPEIEGTDFLFEFG